MTGLKMLIKSNNITEAEINICEISQDLDIVEDPRTVSLKRISYGIILPSICCLGIIGNILNLIVLTRGNMIGPAYTYMRGEIIFALVHLSSWNCRINFLLFQFLFRVLHSYQNASHVKVQKVAKKKKKSETGINAYLQHHKNPLEKWS